jgi:HAD superfamily hydrolase (TIGR01549 family)
MMTNRKIKALVWDFDGTIGDTHEKNLRVTREIIERITGQSASAFPALRTVENYSLAQRRTRNWREFYTSDLGFSEKQTDEAGKFWTEYQLQDGTPTLIYPGVVKVVSSLRGVPHGIVSQNARSNISRALEVAGLLGYFDCIVGYEEVDLRKQKPEPDGLLLCIEELTRLEPGYVFYVGDHEVDIETAYNANKVFEQCRLDIRVVTVAAMYGSHVDEREWKLHPDYVVKDAVEIIDVIQSFEAARVTDRR